MEGDSKGNLVLEEELEVCFDAYNLLLLHYHCFHGAQMRQESWAP